MKYREKLMKRIIFLLLAAVIVAACGNPAGLNTKGGANIPQSQKQQEKKDDKMEKSDLNALNGNIGTAAANTDLAGATFLSNEFEHNGKKMQIKLVFNKEKNIEICCNYNSIFAYYSFLCIHNKYFLTCFIIKKRFRKWR